jgi:hypothetical protein
MDNERAKFTISASFWLVFVVILGLLISPAALAKFIWVMGATTAIGSAAFCAVATIMTFSDFVDRSAREW